MPIIYRTIPWILAALGLGVVVVQIVSSTLIGDWVDQNAAVTFPNSTPDFVIVGLGAMTFLLGLILGVGMLAIASRATNATTRAADSERDGQAWDGLAVSCCEVGPSSPEP